MKLSKLFLIVMFFVPSTLFAQKISVSGQIGWAVPQGNAFEAADGEKSTNGGLSLDFDALYHFENILDGKLAAGLTYNTSILFGADFSDGVDVGLYGLSLYGVKGLYKFTNGKIYPYAALSLGLSSLSTPEITYGGEVIMESKSASSFGIKPEIGVSLGGFLISVGYAVPMKYEIYDEKISAGSLQFSLGARFNIY